MTNLDYDIIKEALQVLMKDRYHMPDNIKDHVTKVNFIASVWEKINEEQTKLNEQTSPFQDA